MQIDRERLALAILNSDRVAGGWPRIETRTHVLNSEGYLRNVDDVLAEIEAQGFVVVPREPTEAMIDRFVSRALNVSVHGDGGWSNYAREQWAAMLKAAEGEG